MTALDELVNAYTTKLNSDKLMVELNKLNVLSDANHLEAKLKEKGWDSFYILKRCYDHYNTQNLSDAINACDLAVNANVDVIEYLNATRSTIKLYQAEELSLGGCALRASALFLSATKDYTIINNILVNALTWVKRLKTHTKVLNYIYDTTAREITEEKTIPESDISGMFSYCLNIAQQLSKQQLSSDQIIDFFKENYHIAKIYSAYKADTKNEAKSAVEATDISDLDVLPGN